MGRTVYPDGPIHYQHPATRGSRRVPVHVGSGKKLFRDGAKAAALRLTSATTTSTGVIIATYQPAGPVPHGSYALPGES